MINDYIPFYDKTGDPIDAMTWAGLFSDLTYKRVAYTLVVSALDLAAFYNISTAWMGTNHNWCAGEPLIFETIVFRPDGRVLHCDRHTSEETALRAHEDTVTLVASAVDHPLLLDAVDPEWEVLLPRGTTYGGEQ
jgi:hypothetical protein